jgi:hypothetical protein
VPETVLARGHDENGGILLLAAGRPSVQKHRRNGRRCDKKNAVLLGFRRLPRLFMIKGMERSATDHPRRHRRCHGHARPSRHEKECTDQHNNVYRNIVIAIARGDRVRHRLVVGRSTTSVEWKSLAWFPTGLDILFQ